MKQNTHRINAYRHMWIFVFFDLPTALKSDKKAYTRLRKGLLKDGFTMMQYSVYIRHAPSIKRAETHIARVQRLMPPKGLISILTITDKQYGRIINVWGGQRKPPKLDTPQQLTLF